MVSCEFDALQGEGVRQLCVVLHAAADATVFKSPVHSVRVGGEPTGLQLPFYWLGARQFQRARQHSRLTPTDLTKHWYTAEFWISHPVKRSMKSGSWRIARIT